MKKLCLLFILVLVISNLSAQDIIITSQPISIRECVANSASLSVSAYSLSDKTLFFQWYKDDKVINGERSPIIKFPSLQHNQSGSYFCRVTSEGTSESVNSNLASVYALRPTSITKEPDDILTDSESDMVSLSFDAHVSGFGIEDAIQNGEFVKIQWYRVIDNIKNKLNNNEIYDGVNSNKLNINTANLPDTTLYFAEIEGKCEKAQTRIVKVIKSLKLIELTIVGLDACEGNFESIKAQIKNPQNHKLEFQWYKDGKPIYFKENIKGIYSDELKFNPIDVNDSGNYTILATIKDLNYKISSNSIHVIVGRQPIITCIRIDTLMNNFLLWKREWVVFNLFFENNSLPINFELYENGKIIGNYLSTDSKWSVGNNLIINDSFKRNDTSKYWVVASNLCGQSVSDTIMIKQQNFCDPFNQLQLKICENDRVILEVNYIGEKIDNPISEWHFADNISVLFIPKPHYDFRHGIEYMNNKVIFHKIKKIWFVQDYFDFSGKAAYLYIRSEDNTAGVVFQYFYLNIIYLPEFKRQPANRIVTYGIRDTLFSIIFDNEAQKETKVDLYYMKTLSDQPKLINSNMADYGFWFFYIKEVTFSDEGYYFALASNSDCGYLSTDTIKVTVIPKGIISGVNEVKSAISIHPNPASDFINIAIYNDEGLLTHEVQILNLLGLVVSKSELIDGNNRIDISNLASGTYFIKIGDKIEKFVKM